MNIVHRISYQKQRYFEHIIMHFETITFAFWFKQFFGLPYIYDNLHYFGTFYIFIIKKCKITNLFAKLFYRISWHLVSKNEFIRWEIKNIYLQLNIAFFFKSEICSKYKWSVITATKFNNYSYSKYRKQFTQKL